MYNNFSKYIRTNRFTSLFFEEKPVIYYKEDCMGDEEFVFCCIGDSYINSVTLKKLCETIQKENCDIFLHNGDMVEHSRGRKKYWKRFRYTVEEFINSRKLRYVPGNHDRVNPVLYNFYNEKNRILYYNEEYNDILLIFININTEFHESSKQYEWLIQQLEYSVENNKHPVLISHYPVIASFVPSEYGTYIIYREIILPLIHKYNVRLYISGHCHYYERLFYNGCTFIVSGGGGAPLYYPAEIDKYSKICISLFHYVRISYSSGTLYITAKNKNGKIFDKFKIEL